MTTDKKITIGFLLWIVLLYLAFLIKNKGQDTNFVKIESIGYTYETHSSASYKLINLRSDTVLVDYVQYINPIEETPAVNLDGDYMHGYQPYGPVPMGDVIYFDGLDDHLEIATDVYLKGYTGHITIAAIINPHKLHNDYLPIFSNKNGVVGYGLRFVDGNYLEFGIGDGTGYMQDIRSNTPLVVDQDNYIAITFNGSEFRYYIEGELDIVIPYTLANDYAENLGQPFYVGSYGRETTTNWFEGTLRLEVFKKALTAEELSAYPTYIWYYIAIGQSTFGQYPIYYQVMGDSIEYLEGASLLHYRELDQLIPKVRNIQIHKP